MLKFRELLTDDFSAHEAKDEKKVRVSADTEFAKLYEIRNMKILISSEQKKEIVETIFDNNEEKYQGVISIFNYLKSWHDATQLLELIFHRNKLDPLSREAHKFTSIVRNCFDE
jgi:hypothetical protein